MSHILPKKTVTKVSVKLAKQQEDPLVTSSLVNKESLRVSIPQYAPRTKYTNLLTYNFFLSEIRSLGEVLFYYSFCFFRKSP